MTKRGQRKPRDEIARNMSAIRSVGNRTEVALGKALWSLGLRYRKHRRDLPGRPDFVFPGARVTVFIDGDYWHARLLVELGEQAFRRQINRMPPERRAYWRDKFRRRIARDHAVDKELQQRGWLVIRLWESEVRSNVQRNAQRIAALVQRRSPRRKTVQPSREAD